jgi:hypothetical protein
MKSNSQSRFGVTGRFKSLPDGRRVFLSSFPWTGYYVIPNVSTERQLFRKSLWEYLFLFLALCLVVGGLFWFFRSFGGRYIGGLIPLAFLPLAAIIRWALYRNDLSNLPKIDYQSAVSSFYHELSKNLRSHSKNTLPNYEISTLLEIADSNDKIIMLKYTEAFPNIFRCQFDGSIAWQAELPVADDVYTNVEWKDQKLHAFSRSCQSILLDENTGRILSSELSVRQNSA